MRPNTHAFTLFELLVVITIIAILFSMLVPVIGQVRSMAHETRCLGNLRQLGIGALNYAVDHRSTFPMVSMKTSQVPNAAGEYPTISWQESCKNYLDNLNDTVVAGNRVIDAMSCPTFRKTGTAFGWMVWSSGYGANSYPWQGGDRSQDHHITYSPSFMSDSAYEGATGKRIRKPLQASISFAANRIFFGDCNDGLLEANGSKRNLDLTTLSQNELFWKADPTRHRGSAHYVFFDGHAGRAPRISAYWGLIDPEKAP
jgi:prepilin-type N-terminal cleavage/methylation domain-containing protein/prepilin-type processing-associated H-X9-DG protein